MIQLEVVTKSTMIIKPQILKSKWIKKLSLPLWIRFMYKVIRTNVIQKPVKEPTAEKWTKSRYSKPLSNLREPMGARFQEGLRRLYQWYSWSREWNNWLNPTRRKKQNANSSLQWLPYSFGQTGRVGNSVKARNWTRSMAERALLAVIPKQSFPIYIIVVRSFVAKRFQSMASTCGSR